MYLQGSLTITYKLSTLGAKERKKVRIPIIDFELFRSPVFLFDI